MTQNLIRTKWKFVVDCEDDETHAISGVLGQAGDRGECEEFVDHEVQYQRVHGRTVFNVEAGELCARCEGEGTIPAGNGGRVICQGCGGHLGPIAPFARWRIGGQSNLGAKAVEQNPGSINESVRREYQRGLRKESPEGLRERARKSWVTRRLKPQISGR